MDRMKLVDNGLFEELVQFMCRRGYASGFMDGVLATNGGADLQGVSATVDECVEVAGRVYRPKTDTRRTVVDGVPTTILSLKD